MIFKKTMSHFGFGMSLAALSAQVVAGAMGDAANTRQRYLLEPENRITCA
jgi:hypothetical protein